MVPKQKITPFFSIITCTHNSAKYLRDCLVSVQSQSFTDYEHIIIDGHSTDKTVDILRFFHKKYYSAQPKGIANAMNLGLSHTRGKYIYFLNSDDSFYSPDVLKNVHNFLVNHPGLDWVFGNIHETDGKKTIGFPPKRKIFQGRHPNLLKFYNYIPHQGTFVKKSVFSRFEHFDEKLKTMMDAEYWLRIADHTTWSYMPVVVANYLIRPDSQSENLEHAAPNAKEYRSVQARYLNSPERAFAALINLAIRFISQMLQ